MFSKTAIALVAALLAIVAGAFTPAAANYAPCVENPAAKGCPGEIDQPQQNARGAEHPTVPATRRHHG